MSKEAVLSPPILFLAQKVLSILTMTENINQSSTPFLPSKIAVFFWTETFSSDEKDVKSLSSKAELG